MKVDGSRRLWPDGTEAVTGAPSDHHLVCYCSSGHLQLSSGRQYNRAESKLHKCQSADVQKSYDSVTRKCWSEKHVAEQRGDTDFHPILGQTLIIYDKVRAM
ncbi:hypothetical protein Q1695_002814 [Nippostrongylus brasiliensis]|nr:hypothetical protein Q1695_002814 [Nippostrongylus brasiliensis]